MRDDVFRSPIEREMWHKRRHELQQKEISEERKRDIVSARMALGEERYDFTTKTEEQVFYEREALRERLKQRIREDGLRVSNIPFERSNEYLKDMDVRDLVEHIDLVEGMQATSPPRDSTGHLPLEATSS